MKIFTALMLAKFFDWYDKPLLDVRSFIRVMLIIGIPVGLIIVRRTSGQRRRSSLSSPWQCSSAESNGASGWR
jgi:hypothetical protein